ncbi:hypothetical protein FW800_10245 [Pseudomonas sp. 910_23]|uniref:hypothetical protein n=1 Tax=Pseudomonas sp. 910_23 TaxID=2604461 RepID=UPI0040637F57
MSVEKQLRKPILIYLDSSDYSVLSKPNLVESELQQLTALRALKRSGDAIFVFSAAHISEMSPLDKKYAMAAVERTNLLVELCDRNALISFDRIMKAELTCLVTQSQELVDVHDSNGGWFPEMGSLISPLEEIDFAGALKSEMDMHTMNRNMRRVLKAGMTNKRGLFRSDLEKRYGPADYSELNRKIPMRSQDFTVIKNYILGRASRTQADRAFLESLRDPHYMAQWFIQYHEQLGAIGEWVRRPARNLLESCEITLTNLRAYLSDLSGEEHSEARSVLSGARWSELKSQGVIDIVNRLLSLTLPEAPPCNNVAVIEKYCPGIYVCINAFYDSLQNSFTERPRKVKSSDFVDIIHALYIPYVSYFRADKYMCSVLQPLAQPFGTQVVASPAQLISVMGVKGEIQGKQV